MANEVANWAANLMVARQSVITYQSAVSKIDENSYTKASDMIDPYAPLEQQIDKHIEKMKPQCDTLWSIIVFNIQRDIEDTIDELKKAKKALDGQQVKTSSGKDKIEIIVKKIDNEVDELKRLKKINETFIEKLKQLGKNQVIRAIK